MESNTKKFETEANTIYLEHLHKQGTSTVDHRSAEDLIFGNMGGSSNMALDSQSSGLTGLFFDSSVMELQ